LLIIYGSLVVERAEFNPELTIWDLKLLLSDRISICAAEQAILDFYINPVQESEGWGEFLDNNTLVHYGINKGSVGRILSVMRKVDFNNLIAPTQTQLVVSYLDFSRIRIPLDPDMTVLELKQEINQKVNIIEPTTRLLLADWIPNSQVDQDGGSMLDEKTLAQYGFTSGNKGRIIVVGINEGDADLGPLIVIYEYGLTQFGVQFNDYDTVLEFKQQMVLITGIPVGQQAIVDFYPNPIQDADGGQWLDPKRLFQYGLKNGQPHLVIVLRKVGTGWQ